MAGEVGQRDPPAVEAKQREGGRLAPDERVEPRLLDELVELGLLPGPVALPILPVELVEPGRDLSLDVSIPRLLALALVLVVDLGRGLWDADARGDRHEGEGRPERASPHEGLTSTVPSKREPCVSKKVILRGPGSVARKGMVKAGFSPMDVEVSSSAMSRPR